MKYLAIIRHGDSGPGHTNLNDKGKDQMRRIASQIKDIEPAIFSSPGPRAIESAQIIAGELGSETGAKAFFGSRTRGQEALNYPAALAFLKNSDANVAVVTKGEWANDFISYFRKEYLNTETSPVFLERGEGVLIDCKSGVIARLPR